jgi:predicted RNA binding protein with dsRBD fold (UPF0201 family)
MNNPDKALETQINNIQAKTGKSLAELTAIVLGSPLSKHGELRDMLRAQFDLGYGDANMVVHLARQSANLGVVGVEDHAVDDAVAAIYAGKKEDLRPLHDAIMQRIHQLGEFEISPKKKYLSLRRKKQFAMVGPASQGRVEVGLNMKDVEATPRLESLRPGGMCQYRVYLMDAADVDDELMQWIQIAYDSAG